MEYANSAKIWLDNSWSGSTLFAIPLSVLTHCSLETPKRVFGKQCRPKSDATEHGIWSGSPLFANSATIFLL